MDSAKSPYGTSHLRMEYGAQISRHRFYSTPLSPCSDLDGWAGCFFHYIPPISLLRRDSATIPPWAPLKLDIASRLTWLLESRKFSVILLLQGGNQTNRDRRTAQITHQEIATRETLILELQILFILHFLVSTKRPRLWRWKATRRVLVALRKG